MGEKLESLIGRFYSPIKIEKTSKDSIYFELKYKKNYGGFGFLKLEVVKNTDHIIVIFKELDLPLMDEIYGRCQTLNIERIYTPSQRSEKASTSIADRKLIINIGIKPKNIDTVKKVKIELLPVVIDFEEHIYVRIDSDIKIGVIKKG